MINVRFKDKLCFYAAQTGCQQTNCWQFWRRVLSLHLERIAMLPGTVKLTQDNSRQRCKTGVNKTEANEKPGKQEKKVNSECNS